MPTGTPTRVPIEWTVRQTVGHIIGSQRSYGWSNAWFLGQGFRSGEAIWAPAGTLPEEPTRRG